MWSHGTSLPKVFQRLCETQLVWSACLLGQGPLWGQPWFLGEVLCAEGAGIARNPFQVHFAVTSVLSSQHPSLSSRLIRSQVPEA